MSVDNCNYTLFWLASDACGNETHRTQHIHITDGACAPLTIHDALLKHLFVYPNPFDNQIQLEWQGGSDGKVYYQIFDVLGRQVAMDQLQQGINVLDTKQYYSGTYFIQISTSNAKSGLFKIVKTRL